MSKQEQNKQGSKPAAEQPTTQSATAPQGEQAGELVKVEQPATPAVPVQRTFFNVDLFTNQSVVAFEHTMRTLKDGTRQVNGDKFSLMTRKQAAEELDLVNNKDNRALIDQTIIDEGKVAWRKVKAFLMTLPDEWILKRFVLKKKNNGRTSMSLNIEDLEREIVEMEKAAKAWGVRVEDLAEFLEAKKAAGAKKAQAQEGKPANVVTN